MTTFTFVLQAQKVWIALLIHILDFVFDLLSRFEVCFFTSFVFWMKGMGKSAPFVIMWLIVYYTGLPMSLSSTSNSLKSSGTFNSNSSINSTPSVDRYAALKDLDDQLREIKEKDNHNTLTAAPANPFNVLSTSPSAQPNPFQATSSPLWFNEQPLLTSASQPMYPITNGNGNVNGNANGNGLYDQSAFGLNGFNGNGHYAAPKVTDSNLFNGSLNMTNGFPQKNPFAVIIHTFSLPATARHTKHKNALKFTFFLFFTCRHQY